MKSVKKVNDFTVATRKKAKSIGSASFEGDDDLRKEADKASSKVKRSKSKPDDDAS